MPRRTVSMTSMLLVVLISLAPLVSGQNQGNFQAAINYYAGPPTVATNTGFLLGGILAQEAHTRDSMGRLLDFDGDGKPDLVVAAACSRAANGGGGIPNCPASGSAVVVYLGNGDGAFRLCDRNSSSCVPSYGIISGGPQGSLRSIAVGDLNGDGRIDVVAASDCLNNQDCGSGSMVILLGSGDGTFAADAYYPLEGFLSQANTITLGDFNGDGYPDIVVGLVCTNVPNNGCSGPGAVSVYLGNGDGTFSGPTAYQTVGNSALYPAIGDFNNDGKLDIIAGSSNSPLSGNARSSLTILLGNGDGTFVQQFYNGQPALTLPFAGLSALAAVDLNSDQKLDLAITNGSSGVQVMGGNGDSTFQDPVTYYSTLGNGLTNGAPITVTDLNGDGKPDLILSGSLAGFNGAQIFLNDGTGNLIPGGTYTAGGWLYAPIDVTDFNGDGKADLVLVSGCAEDEMTGGQLCPDGTLTLLLGNGDGTLRSTRYLTGANSYGRSFAVAAADFNGDGFQDLALPGCTPPSGNCGSDGITVLLSDGTGGYQAPLFFPSLATQGFYLAVADFNGDGRPDVAVFSACDGDPYTCTGEAVSVFLNTGDPNNLFSNAAVYESGGSSMAPQSIAIGDFDGKNGPDIVLLHCCTSDQQNLISILLNNGDGTFHPAVTTEAANATGSWIAAADFNHDGKADLAVAQYTTDPYAFDPYAGLVQILLGAGDGTFTVGGTYSSLGDRGSGGSTLTIGDVNGDGNPDVVVGNVCDQRAFSNYVQDDINCARGAIGVLLGDGQGNFQPTNGQSPNPTVVPDGNFEATSLGDVNGDGKLDVIASTLTGVYVAFGNGDGSFRPGTVYAGLRVDQSVLMALADLNNDGFPDIVQPGNNSQLTIFYNQPADNSPIPTTTAISAPDITYGGTANIKVSVTSGQGMVTGNVSLTVDNGSPTTQSLSNGFTVFSVSGLGGGSHSLYVSFAAQNGFEASSASGTQQVNPAATSTTITSNTPNPSLTGQAVTVSYAVNGPGAPTGNVTVSDGTGDTCTATVAAGTCVLIPTTAGTKSLSATYAGDSNFGPSISPAVSQTINKAGTTTTITSQAPNPSVPGQPVMFKFQVAAVAPGSGIPSGNVTVSDGLGDSCTGTVAQGYCLVSFAAAGSKTVNATYVGGSNFNSSTSTGITHNVIDFALSVSPTSQTIKAGQKAVYTITVSPINGFTGLVKLGCTDYPGNSTCSISPSSVTITGPKSLSGKITIQTSKTTGAAAYALVFNGTLGNGVPQAGGILHYIGLDPNLITLTVR